MKIKLNKLHCIVVFTCSSFGVNVARLHILDVTHMPVSLYLIPQELKCEMYFYNFSWLLIIIALEDICKGH